VRWWRGVCFRMGATASCGPRRVRVADEQTEVVTTQLTESTRHKPLTKVGEFRIGKLLGRGAFGAVYEGIDANGRLVAIKVLDKSLLKRRASMARGPNPLLDGVKREIAVMKQIRHPNCVHLFAVIDDPEGDRIFLVMEKLSGGEVMAPENLPVGSTHLTIPAARAVFRDLLLGLEYLHGNGILHRDIKPENLVFIERPSARYLDPHSSSHHSRSHREGRSLSPINHFKRVSARDRSESPGFKRMTMGDSHGDTSFGDEEVLPPRVKLLDFGVAMLCEVSTSSEGDGKAKANDSIEKSAGTPAFFAPEMCAKGTYRGRPADLWGCGVTLCMLVCGKPPFESDNMPGLFEKIQKGDPTLPIGISPSLRSLLYMLLRKSPDARPTVQALRNDDWVTNGGIEPMDEQLSTTIDLSEDDIKRAMFDLSVGMHVFRVKGKLSRWSERASDFQRAG